MNLRWPAALLCLSAFIAPACADETADAEALKKAGNNVRVDKGTITEITFKDSEPLTDADFQKVGSYAGLKSLTFYGKCLMTDAQAGELSKLSKLEKLAANGSKLTEDGFKELGKLKALKSLTFWHLGWHGVKLTGTGFAHLAGCESLREFNFSGSTIGREGLEALTKVPQLEKITFYHTRVSDADMELLKKFPHLKSVHVGPQFSMRLGDAGLKTIAGLSTVEELIYNETILTWDGSLQAVAAMPKLSKLTLEEVEVSESDLKQLRAALPKTTITVKPPKPEQLAQMKRAVKK
ncbi:leucine-rich repeat domain-containing protein [Zavarzinella formosa]|uniref:hypothetical protein n=1 Tax=Zavarzinella formosa TaxID=360055 RepID=UPI000377747E|nr:hypothetical protein [Zavarzinella formosa]